MNVLIFTYIQSRINTISGPGLTNFCGPNSTKKKIYFYYIFINILFLTVQENVFSQGVSLHNIPS